MDKIKISLVSYLNSKPFLYGLERYQFHSEIDLFLDIPSVCAQKLVEGTIDIGLVPIAIIPKLSQHYIIGDYCIGANGKVGSVILYSNVPLPEIKNVLLDYQSHTSVTLVKVLAKYYWKLRPNWIPAQANFENHIVGQTAAVIIGDRTFGLENKYLYTYDLSEEWQKFTGLPFVFACWVANKKLPVNFIEEFNSALKQGIDNRSSLISDLNKNNVYKTDIAVYLNEKIQYDFDDPKKKAMNLFLDYIAKLD